MTNAWDGATADVVILGAGYAGLMAALGLTGKNTLKRVVLVNDRDTFVERIRLQEAIIGAVPDRLPPLAELLAGTKVEFIRGKIEAFNAAERRIAVDQDGERRELAFERCIVALGSATDLQSVPGADEHAYRLDPGDGSRAAASLRSRLREFAGQAFRVIVVGGGNTATEVACEIKAEWPEADLIMISQSRAGDFGKGVELERTVREELTRAGVRLIDGQMVKEVRAGDVLTTSGMVYPADVCVWAGGVRTPAIARLAGLAVDAKDRILADSTLSSISHPHVLAIGDALHPLAPTGARYRLSAFAAITTGAYAAQRLVAESRGRRPRPFSFSAYGQGVAMGRRGVGFFSFPNDADAYPILRGSSVRHIRNAFVGALVFFLKLERRVPGSALFWIGRRRVSWKQVRASGASRPAGWTAA